MAFQFESQSYRYQDYICDIDNTKTPLLVTRVLSSTSIPKSRFIATFVDASYAETPSKPELMLT